MESGRASINTLSDCARNSLQRARPLHGRTSGPTRRSTKGQWTAEEDEILCMAVQRFKGKNWKKIAECFKDRTDVQCLHRWQKVLNPELVKGPWSKVEDEIIIECVNKYGPKKWSTIAQHLPGRIGKQCRERWHNHLNPNINKEAWTQDEELALIRAHQIYGNKWAELTKFLPGRSDNSIKNHWNSSVKKKLEMYLASGLLSQFQGQPLVVPPNQSAASSSSKAQQSSEDYSDIRCGLEAEEASECSQSTNNTIITNAHCRANEESGSVPCSEAYRPSFEEAVFAIPEAPCELSDKFLEHDFSIDWVNFTAKDWTTNPNDIPDISLLDLGQESFLPSLSGQHNHEAVSFVEGSSALDASTSISMIQGSDTMVYAEGEYNICPPENIISDIDSSKFQIHENGGLASQSCYMPSDMPGNLFTQSLPFPNNYTNSNQYNYFSHGNTGQESIQPNTDDAFIYSKESDCSPCENNSNEVKESPKLVPANDFVLETANGSQCCSSKDKCSVKIENEQKSESGALFYEPPRFPSLDIPFFSCDLIQSGSDMHQEYSPLGIRQLMISSMTPFKVWDSPSRDDNSPRAVLKIAAKTFTGTPSILKKRCRDLVSPLSEKRGEKKQESFSSLKSDFTRLEARFDECIDKKGPLMSSSPNNGKNSEVSCVEKENVNPGCGQAEDEGKENVVIFENKMLTEEFNSSECLDKMTEQTAIQDARTNGGGNDAIEMAKEFSGILVEHDTNDLLFFSPDRFGIKTDNRAINLSAQALGNQYSRRLEAASKNGSILSISETSCFSVVCSPRMCTKKDGTNLVVTTSLQSLSPSEKKVQSSGKGVASENNSIFVETPFKRIMESPSSWKSPWFINNFVPGPRVDTDITIEDIGYFLSPGNQSYDAIGLMKQLGEQTAGTFADAQEVLGDETPETIMKGKCSAKLEAEEENNHSPNSQAERHSLLASNFVTERRTLDFSECETPGKEKGKSSSSISYSSPSSYLLKGCR